MRRNLIMSFIFFVNILMVAQELTIEEKRNIVDSLDSYNIIENKKAMYLVEVNKITDAIPKLEYKARNGDCTGWYLELLNELGSENTNSLAHVAIDSAQKCYNPLETKYYASEILISLGDYSTAEYIFENYNAGYPKYLFDITLLPKIIDNRPDLKDEAKTILFDYVQDMQGDGFNRYLGNAIIAEKYPTEAAPILVNTFKNDTDESSRITSLQHLFMIKYPDLPNLLKERLPQESVSAYRLIIIDSLLNKFGTLENYKFVQNYLENETDGVAKSLLSRKLEKFTPGFPPIELPKMNLLDTLMFNTNQCFGYQWLKDESYKNELLVKLENAKNFLTSNDSLKCRSEVSSFQNSVNLVYQDSAGSIPKYVSNEGYKFLYHYAQYILDRLPFSFPDNQIIAKVRAKVKKSDGNLKFKYVLKNKVESGENIESFFLENKAEQFELISPSGWLAKELTENDLLHFISDSLGAEVEPEEVQRGFEIFGGKLPTIANSYLQSERSEIDLTDVYGNSFSSITLSATDVPEIFSVPEFLDSLFSFNTQAYNLDWIKNENTYNRFSQKLNRVKTKLENVKERKAKEILREFVQLVRRKYCKRKITSEALALLKFNAQYLIQHVGPPNLDDNLAGLTVVGVERERGEKRTYKYKVHNSVNNTEKVSALYIKEDITDYSIQIPNNWEDVSIDSLDLVGFSTNEISSMVKPDKKKKDFNFVSTSLPVTMPYYILTENQSVDSEAIQYNSITGFTLGAENIEEEFIAENIANNLYEHIEEANDIGWIKIESVYSNLLKKVTTIIDKIETNKRQQAINKLQDFVDFVQNKYEHEKITKEARILLKQNANYLKRNL